MKTDELHEGIWFGEIFPEFLSSEDRYKIELAISKWNQVKDKYETANEIFQNESFTPQEIEGYAIFKALIFYGQFPPQVSELGQQTFNAIVEEYKSFYSDLVGL